MRNTLKSRSILVLRLEEKGIGASLKGGGQILRKQVIKHHKWQGEFSPCHRFSSVKITLF